MLCRGIIKNVALRSSPMTKFRRSLSSYYELFPKTFQNKKPVWEIDQAKLRKEYRSLQAQFHPDVVKEGSEDQSSLLNKAYHTLKAPLTRSQYLIKILNEIDLRNDEVKKQITNSDPELLMKIIDIHEELSECEAEEEVRTIEKENKTRIREIETQLNKAFAESDFKTAIKLTVELKYWTNLELAIKEWAPGKPIELVH
ncbi:similar to Saccharomyces cerevisiae YGL018C JAC1 Specialized J-protein that functions with Hsp70 in Fe-S cluster biogenesis in mitochondria, involved in iron metabolism [Maudiozyma saulgeensis]|uniref:Similar to Saccharomyces cerevisiae YGL018C JAC1 Specialized J-protein that functions with Hsp70 in Fe-S cluster biogenesis in mitochondria, involved in iron metabolism n=1 Tax=Maudiozyma saulgeensis TaxID=1789683 RepID=A0A1X7RA51_9SACH|nr:similar to Saccharomyces cerevisiae YGL018C JAC1 Specialized J-protein that functions with Hsp70 in Fe-S cluster biogenesis in mitochondria, involved in iron metabolism [Kazachstania saulgeensis]